MIGRWGWGWTLVETGTYSFCGSYILTWSDREGMQRDFWKRSIEVNIITETGATASDLSRHKSINRNHTNSFKQAWEAPRSLLALLSIGVLWWRLSQYGKRTKSSVRQMEGTWGRRHILFQMAVILTSPNGASSAVKSFMLLLDWRYGRSRNLAIWIIDEIYR